MDLASLSKMRGLLQRVNCASATWHSDSLDGNENMRATCEENRNLCHVNMHVRATTVFALKALEGLLSVNEDGDEDDSSDSESVSLCITMISVVRQSQDYKTGCGKSMEIFIIKFTRFCINYPYSTHNRLTIK